MKLDVSAIPQDLLLLKLYNNALYQSPKFDIAPAIRQKVADKKTGIPLIATALIKQKQSKFTEVDLGAGSRELHIDFNDFKVDFTQYDALHGVGTAQKVIREIRESLASESAEEDEKDNFLSKIIASANKVLLKELNNQTVSSAASTTSDAAEETDLFLSGLHACKASLQPYFLDEPDDIESKTLLKDLKAIIETNKIPKKYKEGRVRDFYIAWFDLTNSNNSDQKKQAICDRLYEQYTDNYSSFAGILFHLPKIIQLDFLRYSNTKAIHAFYQHRQKYKEFYPNIQEYFADLVKLMTKSNLYSEQVKKGFFQHVLNFLKALKGMDAYSYRNSLDSVQEALSCWIVTNSLQDDVVFRFSALLPEECRSIFESLKHRLEGLLQSIENIAASNRVARIDFRSYADRLMLKECLKRLDPNKLDCLLPIIRELHEKKDYEILFQILLDCNIQPNAFLSHYTLLIMKQSYNNESFPSLFISNIVPFLKSKFTAKEFDQFLNKLVQSVNPIFYARNLWVFYGVKEELLSYWSTQNPQKLVEAIKISIHLDGDMHETPIMRLIEGIAPKYFNDDVLNVLLAQLDPEELITLIAVCSNEIQHKIVARLFKVCELKKAIEEIRTLNRIYPTSIFPTRFKEAFIKHLKDINGPLFNQVKLEHLFGLKEQSDFERDIDNLKDILANPRLQHDQRRSEIQRLSALHEALRNDENTCRIVMAIFKSIPQKQWPYLFTYFDAPIIHWSFPDDENHLAMLRRAKMELPKERTDTWLNHIEVWKEVLLGTLNAITEMEDDYSEEGHVASWALGHVQEALAKSDSCISGFSNKILQEFFLSDIVKSMRIFSKITESSRGKYDFNEKCIVNDELLASWLPDDLSLRINLLSSGFTAEAFTISKNNKVERFLKTPYVRNTHEQRQLILHIVNHRKMHIINFLERFTWETRKVIIDALYRVDPSNTENLLVEAMNNIISQITPESPNYFELINLLLGTLSYTDIDVFSYINKISDKPKLIAALSSLDFWNIRSSWDIKLIFKINAQLAPDGFYLKVTKYFESQTQNYFSLYIFAKVFGAAQNIAIPPYSSYTDYLNNHTEEKNKYIQLLLNNIRKFTDSDFKAVKFASQLIPDLDEHILKQLASCISSSESLAENDNYSQKKIKECLENLVQVYGARRITDTCRAYKLENQARYLEDKFKFYPQLLGQVRVLCKWHKVILNPDYRNSDKVSRMEWEKIHKINEKTSEVLLELANVDQDCLIIDEASDILKQICQKVGIGVNEFLNAIPLLPKGLRIEIHESGSLLINCIPYCDSSGNHLSKAAMKFADRHLFTEDGMGAFSEIEKEFTTLDKKSQMLLQDKFLELKARSDEQLSAREKSELYKESFKKQSPKRKHMLERTNAYSPEYFKPKYQRKIDDEKAYAAAKEEQNIPTQAP